MTLAVVGLYAVVSYSVAERIHEMGLRLALGARPSNLLSLVLREALRLVGLGIAIGVVGALMLTRFLETLLFGVRARDTTTFVARPGDSARRRDFLAASRLPVARCASIRPSRSASE